MTQTPGFVCPIVENPASKINFSVAIQGRQRHVALPLLKLVKKGGHHMGLQVSWVIGPHLGQMSGSLTVLGRGFSLNDHVNSHRDLVASTKHQSV